MEDLLVKARLTVDKYSSKKSQDKIKATRNVLFAVKACKKFIEENEQEDRGISQRCARELSDILSSMPLFKTFAQDKKAVNNIHNKKLADEHIDAILKDLNSAVKELEIERSKRIRDWVRMHPVLGKLRRNALKKVPEGTYVLLFKKSERAKQRLKREKRPVSAHFQHGENLAQASAGEDQNAEIRKQSAVLLDDKPADLERNEELPLNMSIVENSAASSELSESQELETSIGGEDPIREATAESELPGADEISNTEEVSSAEEVSGAEEVSAKEEILSAESHTEEVSSPEDSQTSEESEASSENVQLGREPGIDSCELVLRPAPDGRIFTRFRPKEFADDARVYKMFRSSAQIVGACVIAEGKLKNEIGQLPQTKEGEDKLRYLLGLSKEAVGKPGKAFVEAHEVLNELFTLCKSRQIHKEAYILLFQEAEKEPENAAESQTDPGLEEKEAAQETAVSYKDDSETDAQTLESQTLDTEASTNPDELSEQAEDETADLQSQTDETENQATQNEDSENDDLMIDDPAKSDAAEPGNELIEIELSEDDEISEEELSEDGEISAGDVIDDDASELELELELLSRTSADGRIMTRYRPFDFTDSRSLYEGFKKLRPVVGAAVIKERELLMTIGHVPMRKGEKQLETLLSYSRNALDKPALEFIERNEVLSFLHELSTGELRHKDCSVVLFADNEGKPSLMSFPGRKSARAQNKLPLSEFRSPKLVFDRFKNVDNLLGASVLGEQQTASAPRESSNRGPHAKDRSGKSDRDFKPRVQAAKSLVVIAALGRTPLKQNVLISAEILKRLGVDLSILY